MKHTILALALSATPAAATERTWICGDAFAVYWNQYTDYFSVRIDNNTTYTIDAYTVDAWDIVLERTEGNTTTVWRIDRQFMRGVQEVWSSGRYDYSDAFTCREYG